MPKYKIGQKVRVVDWVDMPLDIKNSYIFTPPSLVGTHAVIDSIEYSETKRFNEQAYLVNFISKDTGIPDGYLLFEKELEPVVKVGEQLLFSFFER